MKGSALAGGLVYDLAARGMRIEEYQDTASTGAGFITLNLALETRGAELQPRFVAAEGLTGSLGLSYCHARAELNGRIFQNRQAPRWTVNAALEYERPISARFRLRLRSEPNT